MMARVGCCLAADSLVVTNQGLHPPKSGGNIRAMTNTNRFDADKIWMALDTLRHHLDVQVDGEEITQQEVDRIAAAAQRILNDSRSQA
jgi:hypothetical protein